MTRPLVRFFSSSRRSPFVPGCLPPKTYYNQAMDHYRLQAARDGRRAVFLVAAGSRQEGGESWFSREVLAQDRSVGTRFGAAGLLLAIVDCFIDRAIRSFVRSFVR